MFFQLKKIILILIGAMSLSFSYALFAKEGQPNHKPHPKDIPGKWATSFQAYGSIPVNDALKRGYDPGFGGAFRLAYGFWSGVSVEGDVSYELLFAKSGKADKGENKHLISLDTGLRYSFYLLRKKLSMYGCPLLGVTVDLTHQKSVEVDFNYVLQTGVDVHVDEDLTLGPLFKFRHVLSDVDIYLVQVGAQATYYFR
ncbi:MAG: hypothetical protein HY390_01970 [Deltaproteobacteria bacterium]|nr:hypothetical protein [Deltaproteobacteria bacterium]